MSGCREMTDLVPRSRLSAVFQICWKRVESKGILLCACIVHSVVQSGIQGLDSLRDTNNKLGGSCPLRPCNTLCMQISIQASCESTLTEIQVKQQLPVFLFVLKELQRAKHSASLSQAKSINL